MKSFKNKHLKGLLTSVCLITSLGFISNNSAIAMDKSNTSAININNKYIWEKEFSTRSVEAFAKSKNMNLFYQDEKDENQQTLGYRFNKNSIEDIITNVNKINPNIGNYNKNVLAIMIFNILCGQEIDFTKGIDDIVFAFEYNDWLSKIRSFLKEGHTDLLIKNILQEKIDSQQNKQKFNKGISYIQGFVVNEMLKNMEANNFAVSLQHNYGLSLLNVIDYLRNTFENDDVQTLLDEFTYGCSLEQEIRKNISTIFGANLSLDRLVKDHMDGVQSIRDTSFIYNFSPSQYQLYFYNINLNNMNKVQSLLENDKYASPRFKKILETYKTFGELVSLAGKAQTRTEKIKKLHRSLDMNKQAFQTVTTLTNDCGVFYELKKPTKKYRLFDVKDKKLIDTIKELQEYDNKWVIKNTNCELKSGTYSLNFFDESVASKHASFLYESLNKLDKLKKAFIYDKDIFKSVASAFVINSFNNLRLQKLQDFLDIRFFGNVANLNSIVDQNLRREYSCNTQPQANNLKNRDNLIKGELCALRPYCMEYNVLQR